MLGRSRQSNDICGRLATLPIASECVSATNAFEEGAGTHGPANLEIAEIVREVKQPILKLDAGHIFTDVNSFPINFPNAHVPTLPRSNPERFESERDKLNGSNPRFPLPNINMGGFRPTAFTPRRTAEPSFHNDNWSPLDAA